MNILELLIKYKECDHLTTDELESLAKWLKEVVDATIGKGVYFKQTYLFAINEYNSVLDILEARRRK